MHIVFSSAVRAALDDGRPVVALESTIIAHGFPHPENLAVGRALEAAVAEAGAVPATIAVLDGEIRAGLTDGELERLASADVAKCSVRDLPAICAHGRDGATTVAATLRVAAAAGIKVFATGGIGGVHRTAGGPADVSADLPELARSHAAVVSAGAKSILDLPATAEQLETYGIPVIGYRCDEFPAFHCRDSGLALAHRADTPADLAAIVAAHRDLGLPGAVLVCNPPPEEVAMGSDEIEALVGQAIRAAEAAGLTGPRVTPFLLAEINRLSGGRTERVNRALAVSNASLGASLAAALAARD